jgi:Bacterial capsule synthesis protein PGA_cap
MDDPRRERRRAQQRRVHRQRRLTAGAAAVMLVALVAAIALRSGGPSDGATATAAGSAANAAGAATPPARPIAGAGPVRISAVGDTVMGSLPYGLPSDGGASMFTDVAPLLTGDVVLGNLEGTLATGGASKCGSGSSSCFAFRTPPSYARWLKRAGFTVMNLANNHALDYGPSAQRETVAALTRVGIRNTGRPGTMARQKVKGQTVAILGFAPYSWADPLLNIAAAKRRVKAAARKAQIVVVTFHGGAEGSDKTHVPRGSESAYGENRGNLRAFSHAVIDAGADVVIGHGPHVVRGMEIYRKRLIAYSLGNFAGYKVFALGGLSSTSMVLQTTLNPDGTFASGRIRPTLLVGAGVPARGGSAISVVRRLSSQDFGARSPRIGADGTIRLRDRS